jgi:NAD(P)-dependent dehydrogenase (short-subunit alcohol dehydrogenase family)
MSEDRKVAIITGGGRGMGAAIACELHDEGYKLALMSPSRSAQELAKELGGVGVAGGCEDPQALEELVAKTMEAFGRIDSVVIHTGGPPKGELLGISDEDWLRGFDLLLLSVVRLSRLVTPVMEKQGKGAIVNITAAFALQPDIRYPVSSAIRSCVSSFTKLYADRYAKANIRMNSVMPGYIDSLSFPEETRLENPMERIGTVAEIAKTVTFLLSDGAGFITGQNIPVDGGQVRRP